MDLVLALVVPRVDHAAALGEMKVAVRVTELPGLEVLAHAISNCSFETGGLTKK